MNLIPTWAPNIHPAIVHFPIVLLLGALVADAIWFLFPKKTQWRWGALILYVVGIAGLAITYWTGRQAADAVSVPDAVIPALSEHATLGRWALIYWLIYLALRGGAALASWDRKRAVLALLVIVSATGYFVVATTADRGAQLVYRYGVGVQQKKASAKTEAEASNLARGVFYAGGDSVVWRIGGGALKVLRDSLSWKVGAPERVHVAVTEGNGVPELTIRLDNTTATLLLPGAFGNLVAEALVNLDQFGGELRILHHFGSPESYDFFGWRRGVARLSRVTQGRTRALARKAAEASGWLHLKAVSTSGHYRGYVNGKLFVHAHARDLEPGRTGLAMEGTGTVRIRELRVVRLSGGHK